MKLSHNYQLVALKRFQNICQNTLMTCYGENVAVEAIAMFECPLADLMIPYVVACSFPSSLHIKFPFQQQNV